MFLGLVCAAVVAGVSLPQAQAQLRRDPGVVAVSPPPADKAGWMHEVLPGSDRYLVVSLTVGRISSDLPNVVSVTFGGTPMRHLGGVAHRSGVSVEMWGLWDPPLGMHAVQVQLDDVAAVVAGSVSFSGADPAAPTGAVASATGMGPRASVTVISVQGAHILDVYGSLEASPVVGQGQTTNWNRRTSVAGASSSRMGASSVVMSWDHGGASQSWAQAAVSVRAKQQIQLPADAGAPMPDSGVTPPDPPPDGAEFSTKRDGALADGPGGPADAGVIEDSGPGETGDNVEPGLLRRADLELGCACELGRASRGGVGGSFGLWVLATVGAVSMRRRRARKTHANSWQGGISRVRVR
jgi:hypothetical protein